MERSVGGRISGKSRGPGNTFESDGQAVVGREFEGQGRRQVVTEVRVGV